MNQLGRDLNEVESGPARLNGAKAAPRIDEIFGCDVFSLRAMRQRLPRETYDRLLRTIRHGERVDLGRGRFLSPWYDGHRQNDDRRRQNRCNNETS